MGEYSEDNLVEQPAIELFRALEWDFLNCFDEKFGIDGTLGRETPNEVILVSRLRLALERLNPECGTEVIEVAISEITRDRSMMAVEDANREIYKLLKDGVKISIRNEDGDEIDETVRIIDWENIENNDFFLASQFWVLGEMYKRRADLVGFVNGLPLVFIELKATHKRLEDAYNNNLRDYKSTVPQLFWYNVFIILSNGSKSKIGTLTSEYEHFSEWKKISSEGETGIVSLDTMIRGTCAKGKLLDLTENFTLFTSIKGRTVKILAKNHQFLGVNNSVRALIENTGKSGKIGVYWHTQGSGKSFSMTFFSQKVLRKIPGNWTFLVVTDRDELDTQIYQNFAGVGAVTEPEEQVRAKSGSHLQKLLQEDHRYVFTLIQKFHTEPGTVYPELSDRSDVIVMTDEAHRSQYDIFALNMRNALPKASFIGFTGTPLMAGEEKTKMVFGDYVSVYNFKQSVDDKNTVPLYYENRIPELQLINDSFNEELDAILESAELDEDQEKKLEREFARQYHLITRDDRLEKIAEDIVRHFMGRGYMGKAMVVSIDKATAVRMHDKVKKHWNNCLSEMEKELDTADVMESEELRAKIRFMKETDMAVIVSQSQNEIEDMRARGLDIALHRRRMLNEDLEEKFKDNSGKLRLAFVCAMWMTGFDVPTCSTIYLDKPMKNHTLMQTIARANRVCQNKRNGLIVDYVGIFRNLQKALAIYGFSGDTEDEMPIKDKATLCHLLEESIAEIQDFLRMNNIDFDAITKSEGFAKIQLLDDAVDTLLVREDTKNNFLAQSNLLDNLFKAILPDQSANKYMPTVKLTLVIAGKIRSLAPEIDITQVMGQIGELLDRSVGSEGYVIHEPTATYSAGKYIDLSQIDFDSLRAKFDKSRKHIEAERLKKAITEKLEQMVARNKMRVNLVERFQKLINEYNAGSRNIEDFFEELMKFAQDLNEEDKRAMREGLDEEELALFDILTKPDLGLTKKDETQVKAVVRELLQKLKAEKLVIDWRKKQQARAAVQVTISDTLDELPDNYSRSIYFKKCNAVYQHVYESYYGQQSGVYSNLSITR